MGYRTLNIKRLFLVITVLFIVVLGLALGNENSQIVRFNALFVVFNIPLAVLIFISFVLGVAVSSLLSLRLRFKKK
jgi:uncharacterized membrane protein YciS (DUF1049 family)